MHDNIEEFVKAGHPCCNNPCKEIITDNDDLSGCGAEPYLLRLLRYQDGYQCQIREVHLCPCGARGPRGFLVCVRSETEHAERWVTNLVLRYDTNKQPRHCLLSSGAPARSFGFSL